MIKVTSYVKIYEKAGKEIEASDELTHIKVRSHPCRYLKDIDKVIIELGEDAAVTVERVDLLRAIENAVNT